MKTISLAWLVLFGVTVTPVLANDGGDIPAQRAALEAEWAKARAANAAHRAAQAAAQTPAPAPAPAPTTAKPLGS